MADTSPTTSTDATVEAVAARHAADPAARALGIAVREAAPGRVVLSLTVGPDHVNGYGICHGGVLFALADAASTLAAGTDATDATGAAAGAGTAADSDAVATGATVELVAPAPLGTELTATCHEVHTRGRAGVFDTVITAADGTVVALARGRTRRTDA